jgi:hypothetical protein
MWPYGHVWLYMVIGYACLTQNTQVWRTHTHSTNTRCQPLLLHYSCCNGIFLWILSGCNWILFIISGSSYIKILNILITWRWLFHSKSVLLLYKYDVSTFRYIFTRWEMSRRYCLQYQYNVVIACDLLVYMMFSWLVI